MAGVYIHIPFCRALCSYCSFYFSVSEQRKEQMYNALLKEIELNSDFLPPTEKVTTLYIGGGTPSLFTVDMLSALIDRVKQVYNVESFEELTIETNPDDLTEEYVAALSETECNRLSIGIQSFDDGVLKLLKRRHDSTGAIEAVKRCRRYGFENITIDLIFGSPSQTLEMLTKDLEVAISLEPNHISAYHLTIEPGSLLWKDLQRGKITQLSDETSEQYFRHVSTTLQGAGYEHYEVSNFAKPKYRAVHNAAYWKSVPYVGVGPSAHSFNGDNIRRWNIASNIKYLKAIENGDSYFEYEILSITERVNEEIMTMLRRSDGLNLSYISQKYGQRYCDMIQSSAEQFVASGEMVMDGDTLKIECNNFLKSDYFISSLFVV